MGSSYLLLLAVTVACLSIFPQSAQSYFLKQRSSQLKDNGPTSTTSSANTDQINNADLPTTTTNDESLSKHMSLGDIFYKRRDYTNALIEFQRVLQFDPQNLKAHFMLGTILMNMSDYEESFKEFQIVVGLKPKSSDAHFMLAETERLQGHYDNAYREYKIALKLNHKNAAAQAGFEKLLANEKVNHQ